MSFITLTLFYICFRLKQFVCDFMLQTDWMAMTKGKAGKEGYHALFIHTGIHAIGTFILMIAFYPALWWLAIVDFFIHSLVDRVKAVITLKQEWGPRDTAFWWAFGIDQEIHNFTHLGYILLAYAHYEGWVHFF